MSQVGAKLRAPSCLVGDGAIDARTIGAPQHSAPPWSRNPLHLEHVVMQDSCLLDCVIGVQAPEAGRGLHRYVLAALPVIVGRKSRKCCVY